MRKDILAKILKENVSCSMGTFYNISSNENMKNSLNDKTSNYLNMRNKIKNRKHFILREIL